MKHEEIIKIGVVEFNPEIHEMPVLQQMKTKKNLTENQFVIFGSQKKNWGDKNMMYPFRSYWGGPLLPSEVVLQKKDHSLTNHSLTFNKQFTVIFNILFI